MSQLYIENIFQLRNDNGVLVATNGTVSAVTGTTLQYIDGTGSVRVLNTSVVPELTNLYFTTARAQAAISGSAPISVASGVVSITQANSTTNGYLSSTDWNTFNSKQQLLNGTGFVKIIGTTISYDNSTYYLASNPSNYISLISLSASAPLSYNNTTGVFSISQSSASANGYLSSTDWNTFNSKQSALTFGNLTSSDITVTGGTGAIIGSGSTLTLATVNTTIGTFGSSTAIPVVTVNGKGLITSISTVAVSIPSGALNFIGDVTGSGTTGSNTTLTLATVNSNVYGSSTFLKFSVNGKGLVTSAIPVVSADITSTLGYTPEDVANKSTSTSLGTSNTLYPTQNAVKTYVDSAVAGGIILQGDWNASTNSPNISGTTTTGWAWRVSVDGTTNLGGITDWKVGDLAVKSASGWIKIDNTDNVSSVFGRYGAITAQSGDYTTSQVTESGNLYYTDARARASLSFVAGSGAYNSSTGIITIPTNTSQLTNGANFITLGSLSATSPISYNSGTGAISISQATTSTNGYLSSTDWNTFNNKLSTTTAASTYVPYTGATSDVDLGTHKLSLNSEQFASISAPSYSEGALWYDSTQKALSYYNDISGNVLHIGQEVQLKIHNNTGSTIAKGAPVYVTSTSSGGSSPNVALAKADTFTTSNVIGLANQAIPTGTDGYITLSGLLTGVSTGAFTVGDILYLSPYSAGQLMNTLPPTGYAIKVGVVSYSNSPNGTIYINQSNAYSTAGSIVGTIAISQGGTGATTAAGALSNLGGIGLTSLSASAPLSYNNTTGAFSISQATTSTNGYLSSTDWNTFNNKQNALGFVPIGGSGSANYISKFTGSTTISQSGIYEGVTNYISIGNTNTTYNLDVTGTARFTNNVLASSFSTNSASGITIGIDGSSNGGALKFTQGTSTSVGGPSESSISIVSNSKFYFNFGISSGQYKGFYLDNGLLTNNTIRTYQMPDASGTLALTSNLSSYVPYTGATNSLYMGSSYLVSAKAFVTSGSSGGAYLKLLNALVAATPESDGVKLSSVNLVDLVISSYQYNSTLVTSGNTANRTYTFPNATGTLALTSDLSAYVPTSRTLSINGTTYDLSADRSWTITAGISSVSGTAPISVSTVSGAATVSIPQATTSTNGYLSSTDWNTFNNKVPASRTLSINGTTYDLSADRSWTVPTNINARTETTFTATAGQTTFSVTYTVGQVDVYYNGSKLAPAEFTATTGTNIVLTTACQVNDIVDVVAYVTGGGLGGSSTAGYVTYFNGTSSVAGSSNLYWDNTNSRLGIGTTNPQRSLTIYNATTDNHLQIAGSAPSVSLSEAVTGAIYQAKFGLATASGQYVSGAVAGDFVIISQTGATIWANSGGERMRLNTNGTFSIGNTNSTYNLDVTGTGRFTGNLTLQGSYADFQNTTYVKFSNTGGGTRWGYIQHDGTNMAFSNDIIGGIFSFNKAATFSSSVQSVGLVSSKAANDTVRETNAAAWIGDLSAQDGLMIQNLASSPYGTALQVGGYGSNYSANYPMILQPRGGNVGIGTSSPSSLLEVANASNPSIFITNTGAATLRLQAATGVVYVGSKTSDALDFITGDAPRMRITSGGDVCVGTTSAIFSGKISIAAALYTTSVGLSIQNTQTTYGSATSFIAFVNSGGAAAGNIYQSAGTTVNYNTSSDARLKEDIGIATDTSVIDNTIIHDFTWKADSRVDRGVFAQEAYEVKPSAVGVGKDELTEGGELVQPWSVDYSKYVPDLIVHAQQLKKQVEELNQKVEAQQKQIEELKAEIEELKNK